MMEATVSSIDSLRRDQEVTTPGGLQEKQEAASVPWEGSRLPGKIQLTHKKGLVSQAANLLNPGLHRLGLAQQRCWIAIQRLNKYHS